MPQAPQTTLTNNFIGGLKTEFTGLNFPENSATDTDNCVYTLIGEVLRREGIDFEPNYIQTAINRSGQAISTYKWNNVGGDGSTQIVVVQVGSTLFFFKSSAATISAPLSAQKLSSVVILASLLPFGSPNSALIAGVECQYADGNGFLFIYHQYLEPTYCLYNAGIITANPINVRIRDFSGAPEVGLPADNVRPNVLTTEHDYNLLNQGWTQGNTWYANSLVTTWSAGVGATSWTVEAGLTGIVNGQQVQIVNASIGGVASGIVTGYAGTTLSITVTSVAYPGFTATGGWTIYPINASLIDTWHTAIGNYPSNSDVWWQFKNSTGTFDPTTMVVKVPLASGPAAKGFFVLNAFNQQFSTISGIAGITSISTLQRPTTGTWFQGRVWYSGLNASQQATGDQNYYTWTESIYFSQVVVNSSQFGLCYQTNDPTSSSLFDLLPTDGGVITIQGSGPIYKLFPIQNGLLVFAANGIWFITGSQGIGFAANDYTITRIDSTQSISATAFVNVKGYPIFWNEEGIYTVAPSQQGGGLTVENLTLGTIFSFYANIPLQSKKFARGDYNYVDYEIRWCYRSTNETSVTDRYQFDKILVFNVVNKSFSVYTLPQGIPWIHDVRYVVGPGGSASPNPVFKYLTSALTFGIYQFTFSDEHDPSFLDWKSFDNVGVNYTSFFVTGYRIHGQGTRMWQPGYLYMYTANNSSYKIQNIWNYASNRNSGRWSSLQVSPNFNPNFNINVRRHRLRGHGLANQIKVVSVTGKPFSIQGWTVFELQNTGV